MEIKLQQFKNTKLAEIITEDIIIQDIDSALELLGNIYYSGYDGIIIYEKNITPTFFDLKTKLAGEILQKFVQYQHKLFIIGEFGKYRSKSLQDFITESNRGNQIKFIKDIESLV